MKQPHVCILQTSFAKRDDTVAYLKERVPGIRVEFITDSTLLPDIFAAGSPTQAVIDRMCLYARAAELSGADLILNSCSTVSEVADIYQKEVSIPVLKIDAPMARQAASLGTNIALVATAKTTVAPSTRLVESEGRAIGKTVHVTPFVEGEAFEALSKGDAATHNRLLLNRLQALDGEGYDAIVLAQVSMRALLNDLPPMKTPVLTSFYSGLDAVAEAFKAL